LKDQHVRKPRYLEDGDVIIEFFEDTTDVDPNDIIWEYYMTEKKSIIIGDLDNNNELDFAISTYSGAKIGVLYFIDWYIFLNTNNGWVAIENSIKGGNYSDTENIIEIKNGHLKTEYQEHDIETVLFRDSIVKKVYSLEGKKLIEIK